MPPKLDRDLVRQTLAGYAEVNRITEAERRARLAAMTDAKAREIFEALNETWQCSGKNADGDSVALEQQRPQGHIELCQAFERLARHKGLID